MDVRKFYKRLNNALLKATIDENQAHYLRRRLEIVQVLLQVQQEGRPRNWFESAYSEAIDDRLLDIKGGHQEIVRTVSAVGEAMLREYYVQWPDPKRPRVVCLCGSTRFSKEYQQINLDETLKGRIVLTIGADMKSDEALFQSFTPEALERIKRELDELHLRKIDLADEVFVINPGGYIGESTRREIEYVRLSNKPIRWWTHSDLALPDEEITFEN